MLTFERSMEAHEIEHRKWPVLLGPQLTGKRLAVKTPRILLRSRRPYLSGMTLMKKVPPEILSSKGKGGRVTYQDSNVPDGYGCKMA